jgi:hypothetical protein
VNLVTKDIGYSEYTITGETFKCRQECFGDWDYQEDYGEITPDLKTIADNCKFYQEGDPESHRIECNIARGGCTCKESV